jgi:hypothetical protein
VTNEHAAVLSNDGASAWLFDDPAASRFHPLAALRTKLLHVAEIPEALSLRRFKILLTLHRAPRGLAPLLDLLLLLKLFLLALLCWQALLWLSALWRLDALLLSPLLRLDTLLLLLAALWCLPFSSRPAALFLLAARRRRCALLLLTALLRLNALVLLTALLLFLLLLPATL